jgi:hypothetical protein
VHAPTSMRRTWKKDASGSFVAGALGPSVSPHRVAMEPEHPEPCWLGALRRVAGSRSAGNEMPARRLESSEGRCRRYSQQGMPSQASLPRLRTVFPPGPHWYRGNSSTPVGFLSSSASSRRNRWVRSVAENSSASKRSGWSEGACRPGHIGLAGGVHCNRGYVDNLTDRKHCQELLEERARGFRIRAADLAGRNRSGTVRKKLGLTVTSTKGENGERTYSVEA